MTDPPTGSGQVTHPTLLTRLLAERAEAHRRYNEALTLLDKAIQSAPELPSPPAAYDETLLPAINNTWEIVAKGAAPQPGDWPRAFEQQMAFNAAVVEHLNRNVAAHRDAHLALQRALPALRINPAVQDIFAFRYEDFAVENYDPHPHIKAAVAV